MALFAKSLFKIISAYNIAKALSKAVKMSRAVILARLPKTSKISIALNGWQSLNKHAFLAIIG
jgi:hypothetical protein